MEGSVAGTGPENPVPLPEKAVPLGRYPTPCEKVDMETRRGDCAADGIPGPCC